MKLKEFSEKLSLTLCAGEISDRDVCDCYIGDLLSLAMARVKENYAWITVQTNVNTVAVASLSDASCIILPEGLLPDESMKKRADMEGIAVFTTDKTAFTLAGEIYKMI